MTGLTVNDRTNIRNALYAKDGLTTQRVQSICHFIHPELPEVTVKRPKGKQAELADITIINLQKAFKTAEDIVEIYDHNFETFLDSLRMFIMGTVTQDSIYTNIQWSDTILMANLGLINSTGKTTNDLIR